MRTSEKIATLIGAEPGQVIVSDSTSVNLFKLVLAALAICPDFREPEDIRLGLAPLYTSYLEVLHASDHIRQVVFEKRFERYPADL